jgi:hypothetical protein
MTSTTYVAAIVLWAAWVGFSAGSLLLRADWVVQLLVDHGIPRSWWVRLGTARGALAAGLLLGLLVPAIGTVAMAVLTLYFFGAIGIAIRARTHSRSAVLLAL